MEGNGMSKKKGLKWFLLGGIIGIVMTRLLSKVSTDKLILPNGIDFKFDEDEDWVEVPMETNV